MKRILLYLLVLGFGMPFQARSDSAVIEQSGTFSFKGNSRDVCYLLVSPKGVVWDIEVVPSSTSWLNGRTFMWVSAQGCDGEKPKVASSGVVAKRRPHVRFVSGGGAYGIWTFASSDSDSYQINVTRLDQPAETGFVAAGQSIPAWRLTHWEPKASSTIPTPNNASYQAGTVLHDCATACPSMVVIPAGSFLMGSPSSEEGRHSDEGPQHKVSFAHAFAVGRYEVTFDEYDACVADGGCSHKADDHGWGRGSRPVMNVNWSDAQEYVRWLSAKTGQTYNLLSESEWEYMARAGTTTPWNTGSAILTDDANILNTFKQPVPVGGFAPNAFGVYDVHGNVAEWVQDCHDVGYFGVPNDGGAASADNCKERVVRGGSFDGEPNLIRSALRQHGGPEIRWTGLGFRVARAL